MLFSHAAMDEQTQAMNIEERRIVAKPTEALEEIPLDENDPGKSTCNRGRFGRKD